MSVLSTPDVAPGGDGAKKPGLTALPALRRRRKGLLSSVIVLLLAALGLVLTVNIHIANNQYQVVQMQNEHQDLVHENEALIQQVQLRDSPQTLSEAASTLGMVLPGSEGTFDLEGAALTSQADAASSEEQPSNYVTGPTSGQTEDLRSMDVADQADGVPGGLLGSGALHTLTAPGSGHNSNASEHGSDSGAAEDSGSTQSDTGGGTIPGPGLD